MCVCVCLFVCVCVCVCGLSSSVGVPNELRAGRSGIESRWGRNFPPVQNGPGAHPASCKMGTWSFPGVKCCWPLTLQLCHKLSHRYMFRHYCVILRQPAINTLPSYTSISNAAVGNTVYNENLFRLIWCWCILTSVAWFNIFCYNKWLLSFSVTLASLFIVAVDFCLLGLYYFN